MALHASNIAKALLLLTTLPVLSCAAELAPPAPLEKPPNKVYRQVMPDGRIVYSDRLLKGAKLDEPLAVEPPVKGTPSAIGNSRRPELPPRSEQTPVARVPSAPQEGTRKTFDDANADVIRAEMLLEDARKRREAGVEPLPGERTGNASGGSRLNEAYHARQARLAEEVAIAENVLKKSIAEREVLRGAR